MCFVNGAVHWLGYRERNNGEYSVVFLGFDLSAEEFFEINFSKSSSSLGPFDLLVMKYGESSIAVTTNRIVVELWVMKEKNGEVWLHMHNAKMATFDLNSQQMEASLYLNSQRNDLHEVDVRANYYLSKVIWRV
ncbi:hypothetical protein V6N12_031400 [Hibiscus sabdariffa]|uniref:F-box associated domain-containing protein n=1 Tax=Hibiscus sabdariffa TaxID=183260 RepID=A0ABR2B1X3_9ROSI